jgi:hypothetical protein
MRLSMRKVILLAFIVLAQPAFAGSLVYADAKTLADRDEASVSKAEAQALLDSQSAVIGRIMPVCALATKPIAIPPFVVVVKLDLTGKVVATWRNGDSDFAICFERKVVGLSLFTPPHAPFYTSFEIDIRANPKT